MNISPITFAGTTPTTFQDVINRPQTYIKTEQPAASTSIKKEGKKHKGLKTVAGLAAIAALAGTALVLGAKYNKFENIPLLKNHSAKLNEIGNAINDKATFVIDKVKNAGQTIAKKFSNIGKKAQETA